VNKSEFMEAVSLFQNYERLVLAIEHVTKTKYIGLWRGSNDEMLTFAVGGYYRPDNCIRLYRDGGLYYYNNSNEAVRQEQSSDIKTLAEKLYNKKAQQIIFEMTVNHKGVYQMVSVESVLQDYDDGYRDRIVVVVTHSYNPKTQRYSHTQPRRERYSGLVRANID